MFPIVFVRISRDELASQYRSAFEQFEQFLVRLEEAIPDLAQRHVLVSTDVILVEGIDIFDRRWLATFLECLDTLHQDAFPCRDMSHHVLEGVRAPRTGFDDLMLGEAAQRIA
ncbi:hypothetical protein OO015_08485 [Thermomicrobium sp. 4228-Ro]|nr:hypothetical protein [Thermomicrobium sp. 4228-Ro]MCX2727530.1 hypothetical protein [Thermomicrobium sp. 4228-Ro]